MTKEECEMLETIRRTWHRDTVDGGRSLAIFHIGWLCGLVSRLTAERSDLLERLHEAVAPE